MSAPAPAASSFRHASWRTYTPASGLAGLQVEHIVQDGDGLLWFATAFSGVSQFDGGEFRTFTRDNGLCGNQVLYILRDSRERLWFATLDGGVCCYDGSGFHTPEALRTVGPVVDCLLEDRKGALWVTGPDLLCTFDGQRVRDLLPDFRRQCGFSMGFCWGLDQDAAGDVWIATRRLVRHDGDRYHVQGPEQGLPGEPNLCTIGRDAEGRLWVGYQDFNKVFRHDGERFAPVLEGALGRVRRIRPDREGRTWICTSGSGAYCFAGGEFDHVSPAAGLAYPTVNDVCQDREGLLWFGTWGGGASCCDPYRVRAFHLETRVRSQAHASPGGGTRMAADGFAVISGEPAPGSNFWSVCDDGRGGLWMGSTDGLMRWDGQRLEHFAPETGLGDFVTLVVDGGGRLWLGHSHVHGPPGLRYWDGSRVVPLACGVEFGHVTSLAVDDQGRLLVGQRAAAGDEWQLVRGDGTGWEVLLRIRGKSINRIAVGGDDRIWFTHGSYFGTHQGRRDAGLGEWHPDGRVLWHPLDDEMAGNPTNGLLVDRRGRVWVANSSGLRCFDGEGCQRFGVDDGLPGGQLLCLYEDRQGQLWIGTEDGAVHYDGRLFQLVRDPHIGGAVRDISEDGDGCLWLATSRDMIRYRAGRVCPRVRVLRVTAARTHEGPGDVEMPETSGQVIFEFAGMSTVTHSRDMLYASRLRGVDADWRPAVRQRRMAYSNLTPGEYVFEVKAVDRDLNVSEPASLRLTVVPDPRLRGLTEALSGGGQEFVGESAVLRGTQAQLAEVAGSDLTVLILGETGTGKGLAARSLHALSARRDGPFIQVNCGALPVALLESELFGHERGAFTSAVSRKLGRVELANGGTLFLDEIGDMSLEAQVKLLRLLEDGTFERVGGTQTLAANVRLVAATNRDLSRMIEEGSFREDLYYRLRVFPITLPALRQRQDDIRLLALYFMERMASHLHKPVTDIDPEAVAALRAHSWPGNVRELEHAVQRAVIVCRGPTLSAQDLELAGGTRRADALEDMVSPEEYERLYLRKALERTGGMVKGPSGAAALLDMPVSTLRDRLKRLGIDRPGGGRSTA